MLQIETGETKKGTLKINVFTVNVQGAVGANEFTVTLM